MGSVRMPRGKRTACALCFDFDALFVVVGGSFPVFKPAVALASSAPTGVAIPRILDILLLIGSERLFFLPGHTAQVFPDAVRAIF